MRAETTTPSRSLTRSRMAGAPGCLHLFLGNQRLDPGQLLARLLVVGRIVELVGAQLDAQAESLFAHLALLDLKVLGAHLSQFVKLQRPLPPVPPAWF